MIYPFMQSLREAPLPSPGNTVTVTSFIPDAGTEIISLTRPAESWLEHVDFRTLFRCLNDDEVLMVFAATVMERQIIFISEELRSGETLALIEQYRSGAAPPADVEFEDYSQGVKAAASDNTTTHLPKVRIKQLFHKKNKPSSLEDLSRLPPDQRRRRLQEKIDDIQKELQRETEQSEALMKMKGVYEQNSQLGDPSSLQPQITQTAHDIARLRGELNKYQVQLAEAGGGTLQHYPASSEYITVLSDPSVSPSENIYEYEFDEDFDIDVPIGQCTALYDFDGGSEGAMSMQVGEQLSLMQEDQGDGWVRVQRASGHVGYVPASYIQII
ncbi:hypothetical protein cypCar_00040712 [Cyprinus carpio]|nr:hypothetical protein cypCar_00040712 [Cyprinus carpio]